MPSIREDLGFAPQHIKRKQPKSTYSIYFMTDEAPSTEEETEVYSEEELMGKM